MNTDEGHPVNVAMPSATSVPAVTGGGEDEVSRTCVRCQRPVPGDRSVCPSCGTLQPGLRQPGATGPADTARTAPPIAPRTIRATAPAAAPPTTVARTTTSRATGRRRSPLTAILAVLLIVACLVGIVVGAMYFDEKDAQDNAGNADNAETTNADEPADSDDPRPELVREYCDDPRQLTGPGQIAKFLPGTGAVAYVQLPQPASTTDEAGEFAVQASPTVGDPNLSLDESINLVSMAVCVEQSASEEAGWNVRLRAHQPGLDRRIRVGQAPRDHLPSSSVRTADRRRAGQGHGVHAHRPVSGVRLRRRNRGLEPVDRGPLAGVDRREPAERATPVAVTVRS